MDKKTRVLFIVFMIAVVASIGITFYHTVILKDFEIIESESEMSQTE